VPKQNNIYLDLVSITSQYLGPAAERFIDRQVHNHLNKSPQNLTRKDVDNLLDWLRSSVSLLTDNEKLVEDYISQLRDLSRGNKKPSMERE
jgi:hypothetical protein